MKTARILTFALLLSCLCSCLRGPKGPWHDGSPLRCAISMNGSASGGPLLCGYNYDLAQWYAEDSGRNAKIRLAGSREAVLDSLRKGDLDLVIFPWKDSVATDSTLVYIPSDSCGIWVFNSAREIESVKAAEWMKAFRSRPDYPVIRQPYFDIYNPMRRVSADFISPYDSLFRVYADTLGWDWKLLAAMVYQESKFRIEVRSQQGALGLMQLLPETARHYGCKNPVDPEENIKAATEMLLKIRERYRKTAATPDDLTKYTLAAYNAGTGRMKDCISYARHRGIDVSRWENVAAVIPEMKHESIDTLDAIQHGRFHGGDETVSYVRQVSRYYERYRHICP